MASRKIIRPSTVTSRDGFSPEAVEDLLIGWGAAWSVDPTFPTHALIGQVRAMRKDDLERCCGALWVLRLGVPAHQEELALRVLEAAKATAAPLLTLALRDPRLAALSAAFLAASTVTAAFPAFVSVLRAPGELGAVAPQLIQPMLALFAPDPPSLWWPAPNLRGTTPSDGTVIPEVRARAWGTILPKEILETLIPLLHAGPLEVRRELAEQLGELLNQRQEEGDEALRGALEACLMDPELSAVACQQLRRWPRRQSVPALLRALEARPSDLSLLQACATCGDARPLFARFDALPSAEQEQSVWIIDHYAHSAGRSFLLRRLQRETTDLEVRRAILSCFAQRQDHSVTGRFQHLWR